MFMQAKKFEILEHTADLRIRAFGKDKKQVFENLMLGMQASLRPKIISRRVKTKIEIKSEDLEFLLVDFLSEINYLNEVNNEIYQKIIFDKFLDTELEAELFGKRAVRFGLQIKGVTFHNLDIHQSQNGSWQATILFDI